ncbi:hypothetical protein CC86DRAFT_79691 [Ophiobolus disseminans]|uniref:Uncharacterized protein n=1 Tax=Ophiobolus disseminans TaxID=1469910 RepID=A0A6A6ZQI6_9PLEO|nr:hypothetical protein CC86DRAFT_79691 [Ophiobolus disseminans]
MHPSATPRLSDKPSSHAHNHTVSSLPKKKLKFVTRTVTDRLRTSPNNVFSVPRQRDDARFSGKIQSKVTPRSIVAPEIRRAHQRSPQISKDRLHSTIVPARL